MLTTVIAVLVNNAVTLGFLALSLAGLGVALRVFARSRRPRPALPINCGDCQFMVPRNQYLHRETLEDADGLVHYLCTKRFIEVTPVSPWCELGASKSRVTSEPQ